MTPAATDRGLVVARTQRWIDAVVIGLELCPFAKASIAAGRLRIAVTDAAEPDALRDALVAELRRLAGAKLDSTLLVAPDALPDFPAFNDFLDVADGALRAESLEGVIQIASFHPGYRFAGSPADDVANHTNRSPYPMLHLLREDAVARAVDAHPDPEGIPRRNAERLRALGLAALRGLELGGD